MALDFGLLLKWSLLSPFGLSEDGKLGTGRVTTLVRFFEADLSYSCSSSSESSKGVCQKPVLCGIIRLENPSSMIRFGRKYCFGCRSFRISFAFPNSTMAVATKGITR